MKSILAIFRKDARHLWTHIAAFAGLLVLAAILDPTYSGREVSTYFWLIPEISLPLACCNLVIGVIHQEKLPGNRQYWLTRPFSWTHLLAEKLLFLAVFVNLPVLLCHTVTLIAVGVPLRANLAALLWRQLFLSAVLVLPAAAFAAVTRNLGQILFGALLLAVPEFWLLPWLLSPFRWMGTEWIVLPLLAALVVVVVAGVLWLQYSRRRTLLSRLVMVAAAIVIVSGLNLPLSQARAVERRLERNPGEGLRISFLPGVRLSAGGRQWSGIIALALPLRIEGLAPNGSLFQNSIQATIERPGQLPFQVQAVWSPAPEPSITLDVGRDSYDLLRNTPVDLRVEMEMTEFGNPQSLPIPRGRRVTVPGIGVCTSRQNELTAVEFVCYTANPTRSLTVETPGSATNWIVPRGSAELHMPASASFQILSHFTSQYTYPGWAEVKDARLETQEPLAHIRRSLVIPRIKLGDLVPGR